MAIGNAIRAGRAYIELTLSDAKLQQGLRNLEKNLQQTGRQMRQFGTGALAFGGSVVAAFAGPIKAASDAQEAMSKFSVVFGDLEKDAKSFADGLASTIGRSKGEIAGQMASFQDLFVPMGMAAEDAFELTKSVTQLAQDLGSFNNMRTADVIRDLQAAMTGSGETMKKYGVIVSAAAVEQELLNMQLDPDVATEAQKAMARYNIILRGTTKAQGDAQRTSGSFANQLKAMEGTLQDAAVAIGKGLLPAITPLVGKLAAVAKSAGEFLAANQGLATGLLAGGGLLAALGSISLAISAITAGMTAIMAHPLIAAIVGITASVVALAAAWEDVSNAIGSAVRNLMQYESTRDMEADSQKMMGGFEDVLPGGFMPGASIGPPIMPNPAMPPMEMDELVKVNERQLVKQEALLDLLRDNTGLVFG